MSETTSTNISVAQANSSDSAPATRYSHLREPASTKRICFYKSGDPKFNGIKMVVSNRSFKTFDALLDGLSKKVPLPFGVRNITTPRGIHHVTSLEQLEDGKSYICSHHKKIKPINLERAKRKPVLWQSSRPISARHRTVQLSQQTDVMPFQRNNNVVLGNSKNVVIFKNGDPGLKHHFVLNKKTTQPFDSLLDDIAEALQYPVLKLYSSDGRRILSVRALLLSSGIIVAAGREPFKYANYDSRTEFLPKKFAGISNRVFPKPRSKQETKNKLKTDELSFTIPTGHEHSLPSEKKENNHRNPADFNYSPENEISLTEQWPHSGEELPVISPGDNIEKSFHLNSDGTMTVEMRVRFKIKEEETINWSTTVTRSDISHYKQEIVSGSVDPSVPSVLASDPSIKTISKVNKNHVNSEENEFFSCTEGKTPLEQDPPINTGKTHTSKNDKTPFYRPPTPGIRRGSNRRKPTKSQGEFSEESVHKHFNHPLCNKVIEHGSPQSENNVTLYNQTITYAEGPHFYYNEPNIGGTLSENSSKNPLSTKLRQETFEILETNRMMLVHRGNLVGRDSGITTCMKYANFIGGTKQERPHTAGNHLHHRDQYNFKELKRSVSTSLLTEKSLELIDCQEDLLDLTGTGMLSIKSLVEAETEGTAFSTSERGMKCSLGHDKMSTDEQSAFNVKVKKKKKHVSENIKHTSCLKKDSQNSGGNNESHMEYNSHDSETSITKEGVDQTHMLYQEVADTALNATQNQVSNEFQNMHISQIYTNSQKHELTVDKKIKVNKKMAKVKPRSIGKNIDHVASQNKSSKDEKNKMKEDLQHNFIPAIANNNSDIATEAFSYDTGVNSLLHEHNIQQVAGATKAPKASKGMQKSSKKQKNQKKKAKRNMDSDSKSNSNADSQGAVQDANSPLPSLESYVQSWLKNIFPNTILPVVQVFPSSRKEEEVLYFSHGQGHEYGKDIISLDEGDVHDNENSKQILGRKELNQQEPINTKTTAREEKLLQNVAVDAQSISMHPSKPLLESFFQQLELEDTKCGEESKTLELMNLMKQIQKTTPKIPSNDVAVQVECDKSSEANEDHKGNIPLGDVSIPEVKNNPSMIKRQKCKMFEKSLSLPDYFSQEDQPSPQLLLAWVIVLYLKDGMGNILEDMSKNTVSGPAMSSLLYSLQKIAITENAEDLKAAVLNLQKSTQEYHPDQKNSSFSYKEPCAYLVSDGPPLSINTNIIIESVQNDTNESTVHDMKVKGADNIYVETCLNENDKTHFLTEEIDFFATVPGTICCNDGSETSNAYLGQCMGSMQESADNRTTDLLESMERPPAEKPMLEKRESLHTSPLNSSQRNSVLSMTNIDSGNNSSVETTVQVTKFSKVKMMVQKMEQVSQSYYRQDSEESLVSDTLQASSEIMTESGEEETHEKQFKKGFVKRTIERLYGKAECKQKLSSSPPYVSSIKPQKECTNSPKPDVYEYAGFNKMRQWWSKENILRSLSSPNSSKTMNQDNCSSKLKGSSSIEVNDPIINPQKPKSFLSNVSKEHYVNKDSLIETEAKTSGGVLIDKGRWLLKENHLIRKSPPEITGMYCQLETTSTDTFLDNTSDDVPYQHSNCNANKHSQLGDVSSSEIEDMVKPQHFSCHYFSMPHGSDSEPLPEFKGKKKDCGKKSSSHLVEHRAKESSLDAGSRVVQKDCENPGSLSSFTSVNLHYPDNKVHPLVQPSEKKTNENQSSNPREEDKAQLKEQDSLDKLQIICGQHCPILTAVIKPLNEGNRGFAYCRPYDLENTMWLQHRPKFNSSFLDGSFSTDINNNIERLFADTRFATSYEDNLIYFDYERILEELQIYSKNVNLKQCLLRSFLIPKLKLLSEKSDFPYSTTQTNSEAQEMVYKTSDENNNIVYHSNENVYKLNMQEFNG
ncbi:hypothetical protein GDO86_011006 [Hymenochirus boettgeri]|uniref:Doublecortin domain-containing protein n=1 Tax=Hymenochirus boettgeri TaxID=247094 RepID=A0A8T2JEN6_9PIPI|nr:hypothetical protein GDO86_011006 [Hymenochirus boettgeri]